MKPRRTSTRHAFTLIELFVVITIIFVLAAFITPELGRIRESVWRANCLSNVRQLTQAYLYYAADNNGFIMSSSTGYIPGGAPPWTLAGTTYADITNGAMYPYVKNVNSYACPSANNFGNIRTYSINLVLNGEIGAWGARRFLNMAKLSQPTNTFMMVEEYDPRTYNMGSWVLYRTGTAWVDYLAHLHKDGCTMSFLDGRAIYYTFGDPRTAKIPGFHWNSNPPAPGYPPTDIDYIFMQNNMGY